MLGVRVAETIGSGHHVRSNRTYDRKRSDNTPYSSCKLGPPDRFAAAAAIRVGRNACAHSLIFAVKFAVMLPEGATKPKQLRPVTFQQQRRATLVIATNLGRESVRAELPTSALAWIEP
jgi:hypothetical protein